MRKLLPVTLFVLLLTGGCNFNQNKHTEQPEIHFSLADMRIGAPNELLFYNDEYHLFYQCLKDNVTHWGHSKSIDLIHWQNLPFAFSPEDGESIGSGSVVVDWNNTSGFGNENSPMVALYINRNGDEAENNSDIQTLSLAYSNDEGVTWIKNENSPIVLQNVQNPIVDVKVIWHEETQRWIMLVLTEYSVGFYASVDLINWEFENIFDGGVYLKQAAWKHIAFFPEKVEETNEQKWVLLLSGNTGSPNGGSGTMYYVGDFDGYSFKQPGYPTKWVDNGSDNYAGVVLSNYMEFGKPLYYMGWINNLHYQVVPDSLGTSDLYTIPRKLTLNNIYGNHYLYSNPIEISQGKKHLIAGTEFSGDLIFKMKPDAPMEINLLFDVGNKLHFDFAQALGVQLTNKNGDKMTIGYHNHKHFFFISEQKNGDKENSTSFAQYIIDRSTMDLKIIIDKNSIELFSIDGMISLTKKYFVSSDWDQILLFAENGNITLKEGSITELESIW